MEVHCLTVGAFQSNCYLVCNGDRALVIDPGSEPDRILAELARLDLRVEAILLTHGHMDHIGGLEDLYAEHPVPVGLHGLDHSWAFTGANEMLPMYPRVENPPPITRFWQEGATWSDAGLTYRILETPGHSPGGVCFWFEDEQVLFSGDTLFKQSIGRTDLPGGDAAGLRKSLARLKELPDELVLYPGHGPASSIGEEKRSNYFLGDGEW